MSRTHSMILLAALAISVASSTQSSAEPCGIRLAWVIFGGSTTGGSWPIQIYRSSENEPETLVGTFVSEGNGGYCDETAEPGVAYTYRIVITAEPNAGLTVNVAPQGSAGVGLAGLTVEFKDPSPVPVTRATWDTVKALYR